MVPSYQLESNLAEKQIEADVATYFGRLSPFFGKSLRVLNVNEQITGADKQHKTKGIAYYFQFKAPIGLRSAASLKIPVKPRKNESKLMDIRRFRNLNGLLDEPYSVCFALHDNEPTTPNLLQHNVLFAHEIPPFSRAMYVCPTVLSEEEYVETMHVPWWRRPFSRPFYRHEERMLRVASISQNLSAAPFLRAHATIVPHASVASASHCYSFSKYATDYAFHSPMVIDEGDPGRLSDVLSKQVESIYSDLESVPRLDDLARRIYAVARESNLDIQIDEPVQGDAISWLQDYGRRIKRAYGLRQIILLVDERLDNDEWLGL